MKAKKGQAGNIVWPEVIKMVIVFTTLVVILSILYLIYNGAKSVRGLY